MPPVIADPVSTTQYVKEEKAQARNAAPYTIQAGVTHSGVHDDTSQANTNQSIGSKLFSSWEMPKTFKPFSFVSNLYTTKPLVDVIAAYSSSSLDNEQIAGLVSLAKKNRITPLSLKETIARAQSLMTVSAIDFIPLHDLSSGSQDFFIRFRLDTDAESRARQFDRYINEYLGEIDINNTGIHVSVV